MINKIKILTNYSAVIFNHLTTAKIYSSTLLQGALLHSADGHISFIFVTTKSSKTLYCFFFEQNLNPFSREPLYILLFAFLFH